MQSFKPISGIQEQNVRAFVATDDPACLLNKRFGEIPYPDANTLLELFARPQPLAIMPAACRPPLKLERDEKSDSSLVPNGCPPGTPRREFISVWGNCSNGVVLTGHFVSKPLSATLPKLSLNVRCGPGLEGVSLQLVEPSTGHTVVLHPKSTGQWQTIMVSAPPNPFQLEITNQNHNAWLAVGEINQWGRLSEYAFWLLNHAVVILSTGLVLGVLLSGGGVVRCIIGKNIFSDQGLAQLFLLLAGLVALVRVWSERNFDAG